MVKINSQLWWVWPGNCEICVAILNVDGKFSCSIGIPVLLPELCLESQPPPLNDPYSQHILDPTVINANREVISHSSRHSSDIFRVCGCPASTERWILVILVAACDYKELQVDGRLFRMAAEIEKQFSSIDAANKWDLEFMVRRIDRFIVLFSSPTVS